MDSSLQGGQGDGANTLLHTPAETDAEKQPCLDFLTATPPSQSNVLIVSYTGTPDDWLQTWLTHVGGQPAEFKFIQVDDTMRSAAASQPSTRQAQSTQPITAVPDPTDLPSLGIAISESLDDWAGNGNDTVMCFDSLTALLHNTETSQRGFRFLHILVGRVQAAQARACYIINPAAHDDHTIETITELFDTQIK